MPLDISGWVEMSRLDSRERDSEYSWSSLLCLDCLIDGADEVSEALYGLSKRALTGADLGFTPIAAGRGLPPNPSEAVVAAVQKIRRHEEKFGKGEVLGFTFCGYEELLSGDLANRGSLDIASSDWSIVVRIIEGIRMNARFDDAGFRIVCWASW